MILQIHSLFGFGAFILALASYRIIRDVIQKKGIDMGVFKLILLGEFLLLLAVVSGEILFSSQGISHLSGSDFSFHELCGMIILIEYAIFIIWILLRRQVMQFREQQFLALFNGFALCLITAYLIKLFA